MPRHLADRNWSSQIMIGLFAYVKANHYTARRI